MQQKTTQDAETVKAKEQVADVARPAANRARTSGGRNARRPVVNEGAVAAMAERRVAQLPEDRTWSGGASSAEVCAVG